MTLDLTEYLKNFADLKPVQFQLDADSKLPDGLKLTEEWHAFRHTEKSCNCENNDCFDCGERLNKGNESGIHRKCTSYNNDNHDYNHYNNQGNNYD